MTAGVVSSLSSTKMTSAQSPSSAQLRSPSSFAMFDASLRVGTNTVIPIASCRSTASDPVAPTASYSLSPRSAFDGSVVAFSSMSPSPRRGRRKADPTP